MAQRMIKRMTITFSALLWLKSKVFIYKRKKAIARNAKEDANAVPNLLPKANSGFPSQNQEQASDKSASSIAPSNKRKKIEFDSFFIFSNRQLKNSMKTIIAAKRSREIFTIGKAMSPFRIYLTNNRDLAEE